MNAVTRQKINDLADVIREACAIKVPTDEGELMKIITRLGGECLIVSDLEYEAKIEKVEEDTASKNAKFRITLSEDFMANRRKFSIAHELGHLFLHMGFLVSPNTWANTPLFQDSARYRLGRSEEEFEANEFAAALLMPKAVFEAEAEKHYKNGVYHVDRIADHFQVSLQAALTRGRFLGLFPWE